jgi:hypothetical protein
VIAATKPDTVNCSVANHTTDSFYLRCSEGIIKQIVSELPEMF